MIPILFKSNATSFTTNGIGRLTDAISCKVTEERNGIYELEMEYPANGIHYEDIVVSNLIVSDGSHNQKRQAFEIYEITKPINNIVKVYANHISYRQSYIPIKPFIATGITETIQGLIDNAMVENQPFTFTTDLENETSTYDQAIPKSMRACLGGTDGSILDTYSGSGGVEYKWDNFNTFITLHRGTNNGVQLRYGKNITNIEQDESIEETITGVLPYWSDGEQDVVYFGDIQYSSHVEDYSYPRVEILDLSSEFETAPSLAQLNEAGLRYVSRSSVGIPKTNIKVSFIEAPMMFGSDEIYESVNLCDTIKVIYTPLGISYDSKVIKTTYDVLKERYESIEIGDTRSNIASTIASNIGDISTLNLANNRLVSITQQLDSELGSVRTTVGAVEQTIYGSEDDGIEGLVSRVTSTEAQIAVNTADIILRATKTEVTEGLNDLDAKIDEKTTALVIGSNDVQIRQNTDDYLQLTDRAVNVVTEGNVVATFSDEGVSTSKINIDELWHEDTVNYGQTWILFYKNEQEN